MRATSLYVLIGVDLAIGLLKAMFDRKMTTSCLNLNPLKTIHRDLLWNDVDTTLICDYNCFSRTASNDHDSLTFHTCDSVQFYPLRMTLVSTK